MAQAAHEHVAHHGGDLEPLDRYRADVLRRIGPLEPLELSLLEAHGCVLAEDVVADVDLPRFENSAMDGYAVEATTVVVGEPMTVVGESAAGSPVATAVSAGRSVRIMTGGVLPRGADAVVPVEEAEESGGRVVVHRQPVPGQHVRRAGEDVRAGTVLLRAGRRLKAADLALVAGVGRGRVLAHPQPRVVIVSTGDELVDPGRPLQPGQLHDSNSYLLTAMAREAGATAFRQPIVRDDERALQEAFEGALSHADLLVTSGGVSAGRYDLVKRVLSQLGDVRSHRVAMKPGMPQAFGLIQRDAVAIPCFGLPGNPVSAFVSFEVFVRPAIRRLQGRGDLNRPRVTATLAEAVETPEGKVTFVRVILRRTGAAWQARTTGPQGSGLLHSAAAAHGLAEVPASRRRVEAGEQVIVHLLVDP